MKYVDRSSVTAPPSLCGPTSAGGIELQRARVYFSSFPTKPFKFGAYKRADVRERLLELFRGRCAYCESSISATLPLEVEHFRPKGGVEDCPDHPGYWWLASAWDNLLPSCIDCNRRRGHRIATQGMSLVQLLQTKKANCGKHKLFPIAGMIRAMSESDDLHAEEALVVNPCEQDPQQHLDWLLNEELSLICGTDVRGDTTILTFGLNRQGLVEERTKLLLRLRLEFQDTMEMLDIALEMDANREKQIALAMKRLEAMRADDAYTGLRDAFYARALDELRDRYAELLNA